MKKILFLLTITIAYCLLPVASYAIGPNPTKVMERMETKASNAAARQSEELIKIKKTAGIMIQNRLDSLNRLLSRIQNDKRLSDEGKAEMTSDINTAIAGLTALKTKIDGDTDVAEARADRKSIVTSYRIYMIFEPKMRLLVTIDNLLTSSVKVASTAANVQNLINDLKNQGKDVTTAQNALNDINTQLTTITTLLNTDKSLLQGVTINTTDPQSIFVQIRKDLATVRADFAKIRHDFATIKGSLAPLKTTPTTSPTPTLTPTPTP